MKYYLSLGSNINAQINIDFAIGELNKLFTNTQLSSIHRTPAEGFEGDDFLNLIFAGEAELSFEDINNQLKKIEDASGRKRDVPKFSSRTLDIDIVLQIEEDKILFESEEVSKYAFVSEPLKEII
ncbi:MAG: 2-amino-4-hydroxy-6-hydroxymethyldihydropteridine diphosphokinase [Gammaproteobacteria bacterium]|jgi:2-amino-4-hydroxy-6-hydroxymethyldihydropteridine diphosphokinase|tara:strand:- start:2838 stop:3212 length:375 start_codon:yes stop_codon:yes gene_type:complete